MERLSVGSPKNTFSSPHCRSRHGSFSSPPPSVKPLPKEPEKKPEQNRRIRVEFSKPSPASPLFTLFHKEIYGEDLLLLLLILILIEENADKLLIGALIYVFLG